MLTTATTELIHSVLDGEASEAQAQQLQRVLAADPAARAEFDAAQQLFTDFKSVPQRHPPEGLVAAVMAAADMPAAKSRRSNQLFSWPRVLGSGSRDDTVRASPNTHRNNRFQSFLRSIDMSQQTRSPFGSRKIWIGGAIAAAAVVVVAQFGLDGKTNEKDVIGTIAPAERVRAAQPSAGDITLGTPTANGPTIANPGAQGDAAQGAAKDAAQGAGKDAAQGAVKDAAQGAAKDSAQGAAKDSAQGAAKDAAQGAAKDAAKGAAKDAAQVMAK